MTAARHDRPCACQCCVAEDARLLLASGRAAMALTVLERLPGEFLAELDRVAVWSDGRWVAENQRLQAEVASLRAEVGELRQRKPASH